MPRLSAFAPLAGRVLISAIFIMSGLGKAVQPEETLARMTAAHIPAGLYWSIVLFEVFCGVLVALGCGARGAALLLAGFTLAAGFIAPIRAETVMQDLALIGGLIYIVAYGAGPLALDRLRFPPRRAKRSGFSTIPRPPGSLIH